MDAAARLNAHVSGPAGAPPILLVHGFGCDQSMWHHVAPELAADHQVILADLVGSGGSDLDSYDPERYARLESHAEDLVGLCRELGLEDVVLVGHSVSAMIAVLAHLAAPDLFTALVLVGPSARYLDDGDYVGGFSRGDIDDLLETMDSNHLGWQNPLAGMVMANPERPELAAELEATFCRNRPEIARHFAGVTFLGDNRDDLRRVTVPTLVVQTRHDAIAPVSAGQFVHDQIAGSRMVVIEGHGHVPHLSAPTETLKAIREFLAR
jgi:sigma-B regulation protein RsbQ